MRCQPVGVLKRGKPQGKLKAFIGKHHLSALVSRVASVGTVVASAASPPRPLKRAVRASFVGNVPSASYGAFRSASR